MQRHPAHILMAIPASILLLASAFVSTQTSASTTLPHTTAKLEPLDDAEMASINGTGIAVALENFRFLTAPTSYMEQVGIAPTAACSGSGSTAANTDCWRRGDLRWYGSNLSGAEDLAGSGSHWNETSTCNPANGNMNCPRGGLIGGSGGWFSPFDNPYLMRAWSPTGLAYDGSDVNANASNPDKTIYEFLAPTQQPDYILSFWGGN